MLQYRHVLRIIQPLAHRVVIDATEILLRSLLVQWHRQLTFSSYKNHNTFKALIGITPSGVISFVSALYGSNTSDRELAIRYGLQDILEPGDSVIADKCFTIADLLAAKGMSLHEHPSHKSPEPVHRQRVGQSASNSISSRSCRDSCQKSP